MGIQLGEKRRAKVTETSSNPRPRDGHELVESYNRGLFKPGLAKLRVIRRNQEVGGSRRVVGNDGGEIRDDEIRSGRLRSKDNCGTDLHSG